MSPQEVGREQRAPAASTGFGDWTSETSTFWRRLLDRKMSKRRVGDLGRKAIVFSPHPDDETLGCGGTVLRKRDLGAEVHVVYLTDGSRSHEQMPPAELKAMRHGEALEACASLGVPGSMVHFLDFEDGRLQESAGPAVARIKELLEAIAPEEVFVTHRMERPPDHFTANQVVRRAVAEWGRPTVVWEYPIWGWDRWPWLEPRPGARGHPWSTVKAIREGWRTSLGLLVDCNCAVDVGQVLDRKKSALAKHRSQVERMGGDPDWGTLGEHAQGRFLQMLLRRNEAFQRYSLPGGKRF